MVAVASVLLARLAMTRWMSWAVVLALARGAESDDQEICRDGRGGWIVCDLDGIDAAHAGGRCGDAGYGRSGEVGRRCREVSERFVVQAGFLEGVEC